MQEPCGQYRPGGVTAPSQASKPGNLYPAKGYGNPGQEPAGGRYIHPHRQGPGQKGCLKNKGADESSPINTTGWKPVPTQTEADQDYLSEVPTDNIVTPISEDSKDPADVRVILQQRTDVYNDMIFEQA